MIAADDPITASPISQILSLLKFSSLNLSLIFFHCSKIYQIYCILVSFPSTRMWLEKKETPLIPFKFLFDLFKVKIYNIVLDEYFIALFSYRLCEEG